jgi:DNA-binding response OmpR family regulator
MHVLVVDDSEPLGRLVTQTLERAGHRSAWAPSGADALAHAANEAPDVVFVDLHLADMRGSELATSLRSACPSARLIGVSGEVPAEAERDQFDAFLLKPVALTTLLDVLLT